MDIAISGVIPEWTLADRLRKSRETAGLHQQQLADEIGISRRSLGKYEEGSTIPRRPVLISWALRCGVDWEWLTTGIAGGADTGPPWGANSGTTSANARTTRRYLGSEADQTLRIPSRNAAIRAPRKKTA